MSSLIDPYDLIAPKNYGIKRTPHDAWTLLRKESPVHRCEFGGDFEDFWAITRHADILDISSKPHLFSNREGPMILSRLQKIQAARRAESPMGQMRTIIEMDPPEHRAFRNVAKGFFTPRSISDSMRTLLSGCPPCARQHPRAARGVGRADRKPRVRRRPVPDPRELRRRAQDASGSLPDPAGARLITSGCASPRSGPAPAARACRPSRWPSWARPLASPAAPSTSGP